MASLGVSVGERCFLLVRSKPISLTDTGRRAAVGAAPGTRGVAQRAQTLDAQGSALVCIRGKQAGKVRCRTPLCCIKSTGGKC
jgi:hypothetical protein